MFTPARALGLLHVRVGRGRLPNWYELLFLAFSLVIVFPDNLLDRYGARYGKSFSWKHLMLLECVAVMALVAFTVVATGFDSRIKWWMPGVHVGTIAAARGLYWIVSRFVGLD